jgi:HSP20 family protein
MPVTPVEVKKTPAASPDVLQSFRSEMDKLFDRFTGSFALPSLRGFFSSMPSPASAPSFGMAVPAVEVSEDEKNYAVTAELPGLEEKDVEVTVSGDTLVIKGEKRQEKEEKGKSFYVSERSYGSFQRVFSLPEGIDRDKIAAQFAKGVLTITLPKTAVAQKQQKKIDIKAA